MDTNMMLDWNEYRKTGAALVYSTRVLDAARNYPSAAVPGT
jgi:hypothetical protein